MKLQDKVIAITGGGSGIGLQIAEDLCKEGATTYILGRCKEKLERAKETIAQRCVNPKIFICKCDVSDAEEVTRTFDEIKDISGNLHGLVNNAGICPSREILTETTLEDWQKILAVNLTGPFNCCKEVIKQMMEERQGSIVHISSVAGIQAVPYRTAYVASKYGLIGLAQAIARDYAKYNIRSNTICPGFIHTALSDGLVRGMDKEAYEKVIRSHAIGRIGEPKDISPLVLLLLSDETSWVTGAVIPVDGGYLLGKRT